MIEINHLAQNYRSNPSEENFYLIYSEMESKNKRNFRLEAKVLGIDEQDLRAAYDDLVMSCLENYSDNFEHFFNSAYKIKKKELVRNSMTRQKYIEQVRINNAEQTDTEVIDRMLVSKGNCESVPYLEELEESSQRQLINHFLGKIKDPLTTAIVKEVLSDETSGKLRPTAIGRKLGVHHMIVIRKLAQLKNNYDSSIFGDYRDYLCG